MKRKQLLFPALSGLLLSTAILSTTAYANETGSEPVMTEDTVTILHTNDIHGRIEEGRGVIGVAKLATAVEEARAEGTTLVLDAGDAFQGLPISNSTKGEDMAEIMNEIGYDAMAVGNHEFDFSLEQAEKYKEILNFPILSANTYVNGARLFEASTVVDKTPEVAGDEFVVIGVTTPETSTKTHPNNVVGVEFRDPITEVENVIAEIESKASYNNYIILAHLGIDSTTPVEWRGDTLAEALAANEVLQNKRVIVIDGHSHTVSQAQYGTNVTYTQTGSYLSNIGKLTLSAAGVEAGLISTAQGQALTANPAIAEKVAAIKAKYEVENAVVVLENSPVEFNGDRENVRVRETNLGNLVTDALYDYGQTGFANKTDLAVTNGGGLRATIAKDKPVTKGDIIAVLPFGNSIAQIEVTGQQILDMFKKSLGSATQETLDENGNPLLEASGGFLHISGAYVVYDTNLPAEERILGIQIRDHETGDYRDLDLTKTYYLATNDFLASGGDGYTMLGGAREEGPSMDSVLADYLKTADLTASGYAKINPGLRLDAVNKELDTDGDGFADYIEFLVETDYEDEEDYPGKKSLADNFKDQQMTPASPAYRLLFDDPELTEKERRKEIADHLTSAKIKFESTLADRLASYGSVTRKVTYTDEAGELKATISLSFIDGSRLNVTETVLSNYPLKSGVFERQADRSIVIDPAWSKVTKSSYAFWFVDHLGNYKEHLIYKDTDNLWKTTSELVVVDKNTGRSSIATEHLHPRSQMLMSSSDGLLHLPARHNYIYKAPRLEKENVSNPQKLTVAELRRLTIKLQDYAEEHYAVGTRVSLSEKGEVYVVFPDGTEHFALLDLVAEHVVDRMENHSELSQGETPEPAKQESPKEDKKAPTGATSSEKVEVVSESSESTPVTSPSATLGKSSPAPETSAALSRVARANAAKGLPATGDAGSFLTGLGIFNLLAGFGIMKLKKRD